MQGALAAISDDYTFCPASESDCVATKELNINFRLDILSDNVAHKCDNSKDSAE